MSLFSPEGTTDNSPGRKSGVRIIDQTVKAPVGATEAPGSLINHQLVLRLRNKFVQEKYKLRISNYADSNRLLPRGISRGKQQITDSQTGEN